MKISIRIFAFYMIALSFVPCSDGGMSLAEIANHVFGIEHAHEANHDVHSGHSNHCGDDTCPPFCSCTCCSFTIGAPVKVLFVEKESVPIPSLTPFFIKNLIPTPFNSSVWQPPRFS